MACASAPLCALPVEGDYLFGYRGNDGSSLTIDGAPAFSAPVQNTSGFSVTARGQALVNWSAVTTASTSQGATTTVTGSSIPGTAYFYINPALPTQYFRIKRN